MTQKIKKSKETNMTYCGRLVERITKLMELYVEETKNFNDMWYLYFTTFLK